VAALTAPPPAYSLVVPVYGNEGSIGELLDAVAWIASELDGPLEAVLVVDASPDRSHDLLVKELSAPRPFSWQLLLHSRNYGSFAAIRTGLKHARGEVVATMAADLQEPPELAVEMFRVVAGGGFDIAVGSRRSRQDGRAAALSSRVYWALYRRLVQRDIPAGGVDMFCCNREVCDVLASLPEVQTSLVGLLYWTGFRRTVIQYDRLERRHGKSGWTFRKKLRYLADSVFAFTDLPIRLLWVAGLLGMLAAVVLGALVVILRLAGAIGVPGYAATVLTVMFFAALNSLGLGIIGSYVSRTYENTKGRPYAVVVQHERREGDAA
jgi:polyisoprenyl-phosphate glycosyltransferase